MRRHIIAMSRLLVDDGHMTPAGARQMKNATDMHKLDSIKQSSSEIKNENEIANFDDQN